MEPVEEGSIDPELVPYLLAAEETEDEVAEANDSEDSDDLEALRALVESSLLGGPDPQLVAELAQAEEERAQEEHRYSLDEAATEAGLRDQVRELADELFARAPEHRFEPTLDRVRQVLDILGDPQDLYPSIQIAGTNGKTSTARMIDSLLQAFGLRTGRFTSPHLQDIRERITLEGEPLTPRQFLDAWEDVAPYIAMVDVASTEAGGPRLSFFEALVVMAYAAFADYPVDVAVVETGMGGAWDATNVINSGVAVVTSISLDHQQWLGETLVEIAGEKAGIIKERTLVVCMRQEGEAIEVIRQRCAQTDSVLMLEGQEWEVLSRQPGVGGQMVSVRTPAGVYEDLFVPLHGEHQARNAGAALVAVEAMLSSGALKADVVDAGFQAASSPGRMEVVRTSPTIIVDSAHNPAGALALRDGLQEAFQLDYLVGVYSAMKDKNVEAVLAQMEPILDELVVTSMPGERAMELEELREIAADVFGVERIKAEEDTTDALDQATALVDATVDPQTTKGVVVFGSVVLAGMTSALLRPERQPR